MPIADVDPLAVETLLDRAFGPDRHARTAYRLRAGTAAIPEWSRAVVDRGTLIATIQCWPVALARDAGGLAAMTLVGPVAVTPERQQGGIGRALMFDLLDATGPSAPLMLIGDPEYYDRLFGFSAARTGRWRLPGPFEARRLLARGAVEDAVGEVVPNAGASTSLGTNGT
ncbi:MAG: N-acetyltransferase [Pseudomonadota bacterium]